MKQIIRILTLVIVASTGFYEASTAQTTSLRITTEKDDFEGTTTYMMQGNQLGKYQLEKTGKQIALEYMLDVKNKKLEVFLNALKIVKQDAPEKYQLALRVAGDYNFGISNIDYIETLILLADGERMAFKHKSRMKPVKVGTYTREEVYYEITKEQLKKIAFAKEVRARISGMYKKYDGAYFTAENFLNFREFYNGYVEPKTSTESTMSTEEQQLEMERLRVESEKIKAERQKKENKKSAGTVVLIVAIVALLIVVKVIL